MAMRMRGALTPVAGPAVVFFRGRLAWPAVAVTLREQRTTVIRA